MTLTRSALTAGDRAIVDICIGNADELQAAWASWMAMLPAQVEHGERGYPIRWRDLLPLVAFRQRQAGLTGPDWLLSRLRTAAVLEEHRLMAVRSTAAEMLSTPDIAEQTPLVIGSLGLGETIYPHPATRHTGILVLMLATGARLRPIMQVLRSKGYRLRGGRLRSSHLPGLPFARAPLAHPSGFQLVLLSAPTWRADDPLGHSHLRDRAQLISPGARLQFLAPAARDALMLLERHIGIEHSPDSLLPVVDAALLRGSLGALGSQLPLVGAR